VEKKVIDWLKSQFWESNYWLSHTDSP
jgi:hypothetical protein